MTIFGLGVAFYAQHQYFTSPGEVITILRFVERKHVMQRGIRKIEVTPE